MADFDLQASIDALVTEATRYPGTKATFLPDFVLYGFATDVREHAIAVQILTTGAVPRASFANARAALESAIDASFLVAEEREYAYRGSQARVAELFESEALEKKTAPHKVSLPDGAPPPIDAEAIIIEDAREWDDLSPGAGDSLRRAWEARTKVTGAARMHWSLLSKEVLYSRVFGEDDEAELGRMTGVIHSMLSMASHPRPRVGTRQITYSEDGGVLLGTKAVDPIMAQQVAALACDLAANALRTRRQFASPAP